MRRGSSHLAVVLAATCLVACDGAAPTSPAHSSQPANSSPAATQLASAPPPPAPPAPPEVDPQCWRSATCPKHDGTSYAATEQVDTLIRGGTVIDGQGATPVMADVVIHEGKIVHVGPVDAAVKAKRTVSATGKVVTPGFIDTHGHGDPGHRNLNFLSMGVTTICVGQDGRSPSGDRIRYWKNGLKNKSLAVNVAPMVGHGTLRHAAKIGNSKKPTAKQIKRMTKMVAGAMKQGAWGLTTGLEYRPGVFATKAELISIATAVAEYDGVIMSHMRSEDDDAIDGALDELLAQGSDGGARVHVSHIKVVYGRGKERAKRLLAKLALARKDGVDVTADIYPYNASYTTINIVFPEFALPPHSFKRVKRDRRDDLEDFLRKKIARRGGPEATLFGTAPFRGMTLKAVATKLKMPFEDVLIDKIGPGHASAAYFVMDDALQTQLFLDPHVMVATDGSATSRHPRGSGTFAKVIRKYVVEQKALALHEVVRKMTSLPAHTVRLDTQKRGILAPGFAADVLVFDPTAVKDRADYEHPNRRAEGMSWVFVNGVVAIEDGAPKKRKGGRLLLRENKSTN